ncbi:MAG: 3-dehydroquinate synthase [Syntrophus sp. (in: bacteria)]|nr:3-dehydroquinate synthase [Syntrophus sp. (in: bacteria)]
MKHMEIRGKSAVCTIMTGASIGELGDYCGSKKTVIVTDGTVNRLHGGLFPPYEVIEIGTGEELKALPAIETLYEAFLQWGLDRSSLVIGIGGGIVCDVTGFAASTYLRGIPFAFVPTTLLAQVDASVGGKNGVNYKGYKNLIGTFSQPQFVLCDYSLLATLPGPELRNGFAEVIKQAAIGDRTFFSFLETEREKALALDGATIDEVVRASLAVKVRIVSADERETGERRKLNFGHTLGHALEKTMGIRHGEAVSIGMVAAARLSEAKGMVTKDDVARIERLLAHFGLPRTMIIDREAVIDAIKKDKKRVGEEIHFVLLEGIGNARVTAITIEELKGVLDDLCEYR